MQSRRAFEALPKGMCLVSRTKAGPHPEMCCGTYPMTTLSRSPGRAPGSKP